MTADLRRTVVLVPGAQHGAWAFARLLAPLREWGLDTHPVTLTGLGDRAHLLTSDVDLDTHVQDVVATIEMEGLLDTELTLVGHSYGTLVVAGVLARLAREGRAGAVVRIVYLDGPVPVDGDTAISVHPHGEAFVQRRTEVDGVEVLPRGTGAALGLAPEDLPWVVERLTPQPYRCLTTPLHLQPGWDARVERVYVRCAQAFVGEQRPYLSRVRPDEGWRLEVLEAGHDSMISAPEVLGDLLGDLCTPKVVTSR
jgi:pimeloyl-ACP methyl ester carboxylesterase